MRLGYGLAVLAVALGFAQGVEAAPRASDLVRAELISEPVAVAAGEPFTVAVRLTMAPRWHTYWRNPGDSGLATEIAWTLPEGFRAGPVQWPTPERIPVSHLVNFGYDGEVVLMTRVKPPATLKPGTPVEIAALVNYLVCERECIPGEAKLTARLPVAAPGEPAAPSLATRDVFESARSRLPSPSPWPHRVETAGERTILKVAAPGLKPGTIGNAFFFPYQDTAIEHAAAQPLSVDAEGVNLSLQRSALATAPPSTLDGVLVLEETLEGGVSRQAFALGDPPDAVAGAASTGSPALAAAPTWSSVLQAALLALLGGLVLNLMPCVFPVLSIKVLSLAKHSGLSPRAVRLNGLVYSAGVVASFLALALALIGLRAWGAEIGWGFQLQSPIVVAGLAFLMLALGLNLAGVAEVGTSLGGVGSRFAGRSGLSGSFFTGILAVVVATPCTAPFMGAAIGYALTAPVAVALTVFAALGLGMALPFLVLTIAPGLVRLLPRPGGWMETLKQVLAFPLFATAAWLVFVLSRQVGPSGLLAALIGMVLVGFAVWTLRAAAARASWGRSIARAAGAVSLLALLAILVAVERDPAVSDLRPVGVAAAAGDEIQPFTQARLDTLQREGRPVFLNFTAAWCITCAVNDRVALSSDNVRAEMRSRNVAYLKGDWTNQNPEITRILEKNGRSGVPLYLLYEGRGEPVVLPQILTESTVLEALERVGRPAAKRAELASPPVVASPPNRPALEGGRT